ncbi:MAG: polysaccharide pyruvyl transferase family protein [Zoogloeaceae bacterium]|nr:polysaccharide pyruvyl transferase family protein [Zoogloeaceae bacterium]MCK6385021.1 polysaccharide pyruvyl transferase family protein [Rhodocyclaceae bacterium]
MPVVFFGACDRHNLGDLLFPHVAAALLAPREVVVAGLAERDLTACGGHRVCAVGEVLREWPGATVIHAGGELLTCDAWEAAAMLLSPQEAPGVIARYDGKAERFDWARSYLGRADRAPYCLGKSQPAQDGARIFLGVGGVDLDRRDAILREEVLAKLRAADWIGVRDSLTLAHLAAAGILATLMPDAAVLTAELFGERIRERAESGEVATVRAAFPQGFLAVQFAASFGDDATLARITGDLARQAAGRGIVFFRAGAAPWHDDVDVYRRAAACLPGARVFQSLDIWDLCALIASSAAFAGSSLHGRIVADAFGVPVLEGIVPTGEKVAAWRETWAGRDAAAVFRTAFGAWQTRMR